MTIEGSAIRLKFSHVASGLVAKGGPLQTCEIAGINKKFLPATATINRDTVVVESKEVIEPVAVRYAWSNDPASCNLTNTDGLPAAPFPVGSP